MESRRPADSPVTILVHAPLPRELAGTIVDLSWWGFSARHYSRELERGDRVSFRHKYGAGSAVVVWTRCRGPAIEAGFHVTGVETEPRPIVRASGQA